MGMFDSLYVNCPNCKAELEFQSKTGACMLEVYKKHNLLTDVAMGMDGDIVLCQFCNKNILLECIIPETVEVKLSVTKNKYRYSGNYNPKHPLSVKKMKKIKEMVKK